MGKKKNKDIGFFGTIKGRISVFVTVCTVIILPIMSSPKSLNFQAFSLNIYLITRAKSVEQSLYQVLNS